MLPGPSSKQEWLTFTHFWFSHNGPWAINDRLEILYCKVKGKSYHPKIQPKIQQCMHKSPSKIQKHMHRIQQHLP